MVIDGDEIGDFDDMLAQLERRQLGEKVTLSLWRAGQTRKQTVTLAASE
jgi:S1-C subfamily serine protease